MMRISRRTLLKAGAIATVPLAVAAEGEMPAAGQSAAPDCKDPITGAALPPFRIESSPPCGSGTRCITLTSVPCKGIWGVPVTGKVELLPGEAPAGFKVCLYIQVAGGWWTKPYFDAPCAPIRADKSWQSLFTTGGDDANASVLIAYLVPVQFDPPPRSGQTTLPTELEVMQFPKVSVDRGTRLVDFSGFRWTVKRVRWDPGPNNFIDREQNVWVDAEGLHLKVTQINGTWYCAEVASELAFGYGRYVWTVVGRVDQFDENVVLGFFTFDLTSTQSDHGELDVEFSRWGDKNSPTNAQYVAQPYTGAGRLHRFALGPDDVSTHVIEWRRDSILYRSIRGDYVDPPDPRDLLHEWVYNGPDVPVAGSPNARMNLWLNQGAPPSDGKEVAAVIRWFAFMPLPP